jgi:hypothetical protein
VTVLRCASVFSPVAWREASKGLDAASTAYEKSASFRICWNPLICDLSTDEIGPPNKPKSNSKRQKKT